LLKNSNALEEYGTPNSGTAMLLAIEKRRRISSQQSTIKLVDAHSLPDQHTLRTITLCGNGRSQLKNLAPTFLVVHQKTKA